MKQLQKLHTLNTKLTLTPIILIGENKLIVLVTERSSNKALCTMIM
jgi:hypothetical protein